MFHPAQLCHFSSRRRVAGKDPPLGQASQAAVEAFPLQAGSGCRSADGPGLCPSRCPAVFWLESSPVPKSVQRQSRQGPAGFQVAAWPSLRTEGLSQSGKPGCVRRRSCWAWPFPCLSSLPASWLSPPVSCCKWFFAALPHPTAHIPYSEIAEQVEGQLCPDCGTPWQRVHGFFFLIVQSVL